MSHVSGFLALQQRCDGNFSKHDEKLHPPGVLALQQRCDEKCSEYDEKLRESEQLSKYDEQ